MTFAQLCRFHIVYDFGFASHVEEVDGDRDAQRNNDDSNYYTECLNHLDILVIINGLIIIIIGLFSVLQLVRLVRLHCSFSFRTRLHQLLLELPLEILSRQFVAALKNSKGPGQCQPMQITWSQSRNFIGSRSSAECSIHLALCIHSQKTALVHLLLTLLLQLGFSA